MENSLVHQLQNKTGANVRNAGLVNGLRFLRDQKYK